MESTGRRGLEVFLHCYFAEDRGVEAEVGRHLVQSLVVEVLEHFAVADKKEAPVSEVRRMCWGVDSLKEAQQGSPAIVRQEEGEEVHPEAGLE